MKETDLYEPVKAWLEGQGYTVYAEIPMWGTRADVVGIKDRSTVIVELKTSLSRDLIDQGLRWHGRGSANLIMVAAPRRKRSIPLDTHDLLARVGIGLLLVGEQDCEVVLSARPILVNPRYDISKSVTDFHLESDIQGGHSGGGFITEYRATILGVQKYLQSRGTQWSTIDDILLNCKTHYMNPKQSLYKALKDFETEWCDNKIIKRRIHFRCKEVKK
jgi:hypothetical protein